MQDLDQILSTIPNPSTRCIEYLKTVIKYNTTTGLYRNDGFLISWAMEHDMGLQGNICVRPEYLRKSFARNVLVEHGLKIFRKNHPIYTDTVHHNYKSFNLLNKFKNEWLHNISSIGFRKESDQKFVSAWYHV